MLLSKCLTTLSLSLHYCCNIVTNLGGVDDIYVDITGQLDKNLVRFRAGKKLFYGLYMLLNMNGVQTFKTNMFIIFYMLILPFRTKLIIRRTRERTRSM